MGLRIYLSPIVTGTLGGSPVYRAKVRAPSTSATIPTDMNGTPLFNFCPVVARASDWSAIDADATLERVFGIDLPDSIDTFAELKAYLQSKTVGDIPPLRRQALNTRLTNHGLDTSQVTLATTWWQVLLGIYRQLGDQNSDGPKV
jgi:hypothetical protein